MAVGPCAEGEPGVAEGRAAAKSLPPCAEGESTAVTTVPAKRHGGPGGAPHRMVHTRTLIYAKRAAHKGGIKPLCAALCFLIRSLVCDIARGGPARAAVPVRPVRGGERCRC